ncbi:MAG: hypothetical protein JW952_06210 [Candidatus Eisenbacteria bacterium]|nr:hypothetical protein [Candidatus Eisenbacteria bacterium]
MAELETERHEATLRDYLGIMFRQKWVIITVLAIPTLIVLVQTLGSRTLYKSTATVLLRRGQKESAMVTYVTVLPWEEQVSSEEQTATSMMVVGKAQTILNGWQAGVPEDKRVRIRASAVEAGIVGESNVLAISYVDYKPEVAKQVTHAVTEAYMQYRQESGLAPALAGFFDSQIDTVRTHLERLRAEREQFMRQQGVNDLGTKTRTLLEFWKDLSHELSDAVTARLVEETNVNEMKKLLENPDVEVPLLTEIPLGGAGVMNALRESRDVMRAELQKTRAAFTEKDQRVVALQRQLAEVERQLDREIRQALALAQARLAPLVAKENELKKQVVDVESKLLGYPEQDAVLADLNTNIRIMERDYEMLTSKKIEAMVSRESSPEWNVMLLSPPSEPAALRTRDYVRLSLGPLLGLLVGVGLAFLFDSLDHSIKSKADAEKVLGLPVLASINEVRAGGRRK